MHVYVHLHIYLYRHIHTCINTYNIDMVRIPFGHTLRDTDSSHTQWLRRYGACPMGTAGKPPDCAQCETGYVPPRLPGALPNRD